MCLLRLGVSHCLPSFLQNRSVVCDDLLGNVVNQGSLVDVGGGVEHAIIQALFDDFPDGGLRQAPGVPSSRLLVWWLLSAHQYCLHLHLDETVV